MNVRHLEARLSLAHYLLRLFFPGDQFTVWVCPRTGRTMVASQVAP